MNKFSALFNDEVSTILQRVHTALSPSDGANLTGTSPLTPRFTKLAQVFGLSPAETNFLQCLIAGYVDPRLPQEFKARSGFAFVTEYLIREVFDHGPMPIYASDSPLNVWCLVQAQDMGPGQPIGFDLDLAVLEWLAGKPGLEPRLQRLLSRPEPLFQDFAPQHMHALRQIKAHMQTGQPLICLLHLDDGAEAEDFLATAARQSDVPFWSIQNDEMALSDHDVLKLHRFARVQNAALAWASASDACLQPALVPATHLQFAPRGPAATLGKLDARSCLTVHVAPPDRAALVAMLHARFPDAGASAIRRVAGIKGLSPRRILAPEFDTIDALLAAQNAANADALLDWAVPLKTDMRFDDLVLEDGLKTQMRQLVREIKAHADLWQKPEVARVYAQERALTILLKGPPGTGKTLSARVLAGEAGVPLYRVDAASMTSKYIGDTSRNMRALFRAANASGAMLFIDEFEALVGKRTETRNEIARSYNHDTAYFLQLIETQFQGVAVFATNRPAEIDDAMHRRIRKVIDFALPDKPERAQLWRLALRPFDPMPEVIEFSELLAENFVISGSRIKAVVLNAYALGHGQNSGITCANLRDAALQEARNNGRMPARRELARLLAFGTHEREEPVQ